MAPSTLAGVVTASGVLSLLLTSIAALITAWAARRTSQRVEAKVTEGNRQIAEVHVIVNHQRDVMQQIITDGANYNRALIRALEARGIEIPVDQSIPSALASGAGTKLP